MKKLLVTIIFLLLSFSIYSQSKIIGEVVYLNSDNKAANGVEIMAEGSSGAVSKNGSYILNFPNLNAGATVFPKIGAEIVTNEIVSNIELVNKERLEFVNIPEDASKAPLKIVVCPKGFRDENAKKYYKIIRTKTENILDQKKRFIEKMKKDLASSNNAVITRLKELDELQIRFRDTIAAYKEAMGYASINRDEADSRVIFFLNLLDEGEDIEEALKALNVENAYLEAIKEGKNIDASITEIETAAKGDISIYKFEQAIQKYDTISIILRNKRYNPRLLISNLHTVGVLCQKQNYFIDAERNYKEILRVYKNEGYNTKDYTYPSILNNLGVLQRNKNKFPQALENYQEALKISRELAEETPKTYLPDVVMTLINLANIQKDKNEFSKALENYQEALKISRELANENPKTYLKDVAAILNNLAILQKDKNEFSQALENYQEALKIRRELAEENPKTYLPGVASTLNNLASLQMAKNEFPQALENFHEALKIRRELAKENPRTYLTDVATTLNNLAILQEDKNEFPQALENHQEALKIYRELSKENPRMYLPDVAMSLNNLAVLQKNKNEFPQALANYQEALKIRRELAEENPKTYLQDVAATLNNLANLQKDKYEFSQALKNYQEALKIRKGLAKENPKTYLQDVATTLNNLAVLQKDINELPKALENYKEALRIRRELAEENPKTYLQDVARTLHNLGNLADDRNEYLEALKNYEEALEIFRELAEENPKTYLQNVAKTLNNLAISQTDNNELPKALENYQEALKIRRKLAEENPKTYFQDLAETLHNLANLQLNKNEFSQACETYKEALEIYIELIKINPRKFNLELARTYLAFSYLKKDQLEFAFDTKTKNEGIKLVESAKEALNLYDDENPTKISYGKIILSLASFFKNVNENSAKFTNLKNEIYILKKQIETEDNPNKKVTIQKEIIENVVSFSKIDPNNKETIVLLSQNYGSLAWFSLFTKDFVLAEKSAKKGLELSPNEEWINTNLVLAYVIQDKYDMALPIYNNMKDKPYASGTYATTFLEDIETLEKSGITHKDFERVKKLLKG